MKKQLFSCLLTCSILTGCHLAHPDKIIIQGKIDIPDNYRIFLQSSQEKWPLQADSLNNTYSFELNHSASGFLTFQGVIEDTDGPWPFSETFYGIPGSIIHADLKAGDRRMETSVDSGDKNNSALVNYNQFSMQHIYELWTDTPAPGQAKAFLQKFIDEANRLSGQPRLKEPVKKYLRIKSYLDYFKGIDNLTYIYGQDKTRQLPTNLAEGLPAIETVLNDTLALLFPDDLQNTIYKYLCHHSYRPENQLTLLQEKFSEPQIRYHLTNFILEGYVLSYNYSRDFESGLSRLKEMGSSLPDKGEKYIRDFEAKRHTLAGSMLPDIPLETPDGKTCKLSDLKGTALYIDLWASWCVPCCKEVPYLQKLEKEMKNKNVKFISISMDENKEAWKERMKQLKMEGNQYIAIGKELNTMLNIQSIPHFLIYDKDGKLILYKAPRPSQDEEVKKILNSLR